MHVCTDKSIEVPYGIHLFHLNKEKENDQLIVITTNTASCEERRLAAEAA